MSFIFRFTPVLVSLWLIGCAGLPHDTPPAISAGAASVAPGSVLPATTADVLTAQPSKAQDRQDPVPPHTSQDADSVYFRLGATNIDAEGKKKLRQHAAKLKKDSDLEVTLIGYTDNLGSSSYNLAIAAQRIDVVAGELIAHGARKNQIRRYPVGDEKTELDCKARGCRQKMRRVELIYSK